MEQLRKLHVQKWEVLVLHLVLYTVTTWLQTSKRKINKTSQKYLNLKRPSKNKDKPELYSTIQSVPHSKHFSSQL